MIALGYEQHEINVHIVEDLTRLRDELVHQAFDSNEKVKDSTLATVIFKINSCLFSGYPRRKSE